MIPSLEGWLTKAKEAPSPHEARLPTGHQPSISKSRGGGLVGNSYFSRTKKEWLYIVLLDALENSVKTEKMVQDLTAEELNTMEWIYYFKN